MYFSNHALPQPLPHSQLPRQGMSWSRVGSLSPFQIGLLAPKGWSPTRMLCVSSVVLARVVCLLGITSLWCGCPHPPDCANGPGCETMRGRYAISPKCVSFHAASLLLLSFAHAHAHFRPFAHTHRRPPPPPPQHHGLRPCRHRLRRGLLGHPLSSHLHRYVRRGSSLFYLWGVVGRTGNEIQRVCTSYKQVPSTHTHTLSTPTTPAYLNMSRGPADPLQRSGQKPHRA